MSDLAADLNRVVRDQSHANIRPKDAATLILIDRSATPSRVLLGRRHASHKFMPGKFVFPGGRVEPLDKKVPVLRPLDPRVEARLLARMKRPSAARARALAVAAVRETFEETGLLLGAKHEDGAPFPWTKFKEAGVRPDLSNLHFIAHAITPPRRPRRFDTRFFAVDAEAIAHRIPGVVTPDTELIELVWIPIAEAQQLDLPPITQAVLKELQSRIEAGFSHDLPVPFYRMLNRKFTRVMI